VTLDASSLRAVPFVGRASDLDAIAKWLDEGARIVTLVGPGGAGKTALAIELAARRVASGARSGVIVCDVSTARTAIDPKSTVVDAMATACGIEAGADVSRIGAAIAARGEVLVVVDDFEGVVEHASSTIGVWARTAPEAELLVTSRERLALAGEIVHEVGPLGSDGVELLVASAQRRAAGFALRDDDLAAARRIVEVLDGLPLGLDMAGARIPFVGARAVLAEIEASLDSLRRDVRGGPARHATLDAAVRGSFDALEETDRGVLAQLTVFRGGFTAEAVAGVVEGEGSALESLARLRDKSLVRMRDAASARFDLFAPIHAFVAREQPGPIAAAEERHAAWFSAKATEAGESAHRDRRARAWLAAERDNLLAISERLVAGAAPVTARSAEPALRALVALCPLLLLSRRPLAGLAAIVAPVVERTRDSGADPTLTARAMLLRGALRREAKDVRGALKDFLGAESIARGSNDALLEADAQVELGRTLLLAKEGDAARRQLEKAAHTFGRLGARAREANALAWRARAHRDERDLDANARRAWLERAVGLARGEDGLHGRLLLDLGDEIAVQLARAPAKAALSEAIVVAVRERDPLMEAEARAKLGAVLIDAFLVGDSELEPAARELAMACDLYETQGLELEAALVRGDLGLVARLRGHETEAITLLADARDAAIRADRTEEATRFAELLDPPEPAPGMPRSPRPPPDALVIGEAGVWFRPPHGARVGLERRKNLSRILDHLVATRESGTPTTSAALFDIAWPGEKALPHAAAHRVRVAVATLRKMGLAEAITTTGTGYAIAEGVAIVRA